MNIVGSQHALEPTRLALTPKQRNFVEVYLETGSGPDAALTAYGCSNRNSARVLAHRLLHNEKVWDYLEHLAREGGLADGAVKVLRDATLAEKSIRVNGRLIYKPDWRARLEATKHVLRIMGLG